MIYHSTRDRERLYSFQEVLFRGLADDGGLYLPATIPTFDLAKIDRLRTSSYQEIVFEVARCFIDGLSDEELREVIRLAYQDFKVTELAPLKKLDRNFFFLELFHLSTLAFKDYAMQFLGQLFNYLTQKEGRRLVVLGATSGDTGSAAIQVFKKNPSAEVFILHPHQKISPLQRKQMSTVQEPNIHNIAIEGHFDHCQQLVKIIFNDQDFRLRLGDSSDLITVNSINWARIVAQISYYFSAYFQSQTHYPEPAVFCVPTGNFGNIFAGIMAKRMGLPVRKFVLATNKNDILHRFVKNNHYCITKLQSTFSPSMDILIASNLERYLYLICQDAVKVKNLMDEFRQSGKMSIDPQLHQKISSELISESVDDRETLSMIREINRRYGMVVDPHSAVAFRALERVEKHHPDLTTGTRIVLGTAHPGKFIQTIEQAGVPFELPSSLHHLEDLPEKFKVLPNDLEAVKDEIIHSIK